MNWIILTNADLEAALNKPQLEVLKAAEFSSAGHDIVADIISSIVARIRAEIAACPINILDIDHLRIPHELKECALSLALEALQSRIPDMHLGDLLDKRADIARETLMRVSLGQLPISRPMCGIRGANRKGVQVCAARKNTIRRGSMGGL